jgi:hypothetical protein
MREADRFPDQRHVSPYIVGGGTSLSGAVMSEVDHPIVGSLAEGEELVATARARDAEMVVTNVRIAVAADDGRLAMDLPIEGVRRIQFDVERQRPATLVIVPDEAGREPQILAIPPEQLDATAQALAFIGKRLSRAS